MQEQNRALEIGTKLAVGKHVLVKLGVKKFVHCEYRIMGDHYTIDYDF